MIFLEMAMREFRWAGPAFAMVLTGVLCWLGSAARAEPLLRSGIGLQTCEKLGPDLKPSEGLDHLPNTLLFYWVQGYLSAANIHLLNEYNDYVDVGAIDAKAILPMIAKFCKANPDKRPVNAMDKFITDADKIDVKEADAFDPWDH
jgi:hypothetical protein